MGASHHMCNDRSSFTTFKKLHSLVHIKLGNDSKAGYTIKIKSGICAMSSPAHPTITGHRIGNLYFINTSYAANAYTSTISPPPPPALISPAPPALTLAPPRRSLRQQPRRSFRLRPYVPPKPKERRERGGYQAKTRPTQPPYPSQNHAYGIDASPTSILRHCDR